MSTCDTGEKLCDFHRGDTLPFDFLFENDDGTPMDITNMTVWFTMKMDSSVLALDQNDIQVKKHFDPGDPGNDYINGAGNMTVPTSKTTNLLPEKVYFYDFQLVQPKVDPEEDFVFTLEADKVGTLQDVTQITE